MGAILKLWLTRLVHRRTAAPVPRLTARTSAPQCPVCRGTGRVQAATWHCLCGCGKTLPVWGLCAACGTAGVVPAATLARDPGDSTQLRAYVGGFVLN